MNKEETKDTKKTKSRKKKYIIITLSILMFFVVLLASGYLYVRGRIYRQTKPSNTVTSTNNKENKEETVEYTEVKGITNVLLLGVDGINFDSSDQRSDSMIIATLDNNNKKVKLTSLYRDALVYIPGYGENKMNASFSLGGPELVMDTIRYNYDINIEKYVMINFVGFETIIDQIGGLEIDVQEYQLNELNKYIGEATGGNDCPVEEPGLQILNGKQALSYARIRKGVGDDYERTERQREVLFKVAEKLKETNPIKYLGIMNKMLDYIRTNIEPYECLNMAYTIFKFPELVTEQLSIPVPELSTDVQDPVIGWVISANLYENGQILNDFIFNDYLPDYILNRSTEKDPSIYFEYDGFGSDYDDYDVYYDYDYYYDDYYYEEEYYPGNNQYYQDDYYYPTIDTPEEEESELPEENLQPELDVPLEGDINTGETTVPPVEVNPEETNRGVRRSQ